jgi:Flp pilus assembly protein TadG
VTDERGSAAVELAVLAPALVVLMLLVVAGGRVTTTDATVRRLAADAARAASLTRSPDAARAAATDAASAGLAGADGPCQDVTTLVDTSRFEAGGRVTVDVACTVEFRDVAVLAVPGTRTFHATGVEVIDRYRSAP